MINKLSYIKCLFLSAILVVLLIGTVNSQGTDSKRTFTKSDKLYIGINLLPSMTNIDNKVFVSSAEPGLKGRNSLNFNLDFGYYFSKISGISIGAGYCSYSTELTMDSYSTKFQTIDSENETYEMQIKGTSIVENQKLSFFNIPICLNLRLPVGEKIGFFLTGGISLDIPVTKTFKAEGTFTYDGYYAVYPILFQDIPAYGFPSNLNTLTSGNLQIKNLNATFCASGGAYFNLNEKFQVVVGVSYNKSITSISAYTTDPDFRLTSKANELNSFMAGSKEVRLQSLGINIGLKYYFK